MKPTPCSSRTPCMWADRVLTSLWQLHHFLQESELCLHSHLAAPALPAGGRVVSLLRSGSPSTPCRAADVVFTPLLQLPHFLQEGGWCLHSPLATPALQEGGWCFHSPLAALTLPDGGRLKSSLQMCSSISSCKRTVGGFVLFLQLQHSLQEGRRCLQILLQLQYSMRQRMSTLPSGSSSAPCRWENDGFTPLWQEKIPIQEVRGWFRYLFLQDSLQYVREPQ